MPTITCACGSRFSVERANYDGSVFCPTCGQALVPQDQIVAPKYGHAVQGGQFVAGAGIPPQAHPQVGYQPREENPSAVAGFILGLLSFFGCLLLAPFAVFISAKGLSKDENKGLAVAGLIMGIFQSMVLLGLVVYFIFMIVVVGGFTAATATVVADAARQAALEAEKRMETENALNEAYEEFVAFEFENDRWPNQSEGDSIVEDYEDGWGQTLEYQPPDRSDARILSRGEDRTADSFDDIERVFYDSGAGISEVSVPEFNIDSLIGDSSSTEDRIGSIDQALELLASSHYPDQSRAHEWLMSQPVEDAHREDVVAAAVDRMDHRGRRDALTKLAIRWASSEESALLGDYLDSLERHDVDYMIVSLGEALVELEAWDQVVRFINHDSDELRNLCRRNIGSGKVESVEALEQCVSDLELEERRESGLEYLEAAEIVPSMKEEVALRIDPLLLVNDYRVKQSAIRALKHWGPVPANLDSLRATGDLDLLLAIRNDETLEIVTEQLKRWPVDHRKAAEKLREMGTAGEAAVWPVLEMDNHVIVMDALRLLMDIGSEASIPKIEPLTEHRFVGNVAKATLARIEQANRSPEPWTPSELENDADN